MSDQKHTPTPWEARYDGEGHPLYIVNEKGQEIIEVLPLYDGQNNTFKREEQLANQNIVVTAVNNHEALVTNLAKMTDWGNRLKTFFDEHDHPCGELVDDLINATSALADVEKGE